MIEVIYKEERAGEEDELGFYLPRNIRQVGLIHENYRIYMEDYVYSFLGKVAALTMKMERLGRAAVLTGEIRWKNGVTYVFVRGAVLIEKTELAADHVVLGEETWKGIGEACASYFPHQEVVGWFLAQAEMQIHATEILTRAHIKYFGGEKILFLMEPTEREDAFFRFENNFLVKQSGYYLYYEKNEPMQNYMLTQEEILESNIIEKTEDEAVKNFRKIIQDKNENKGENNSVLSMVAAVCLVLSVGSVGVRFYQNYQKMQSYGMVQEADSANSFQVSPVLTGSSETETIPSEEEEKLAKKVQAEQSSVRITEKLQKENALVTSRIPFTQQDEKKKEVEEKTDSDKKGTEEKIGKKQKNEQETAAEAISQKDTFSYVVRPGDSLFKISLEQYGTMDKIPEICQLNGFSEEEVIYPGQIIVLP